MRKAVILTMFGISMFMLLRAWYQQGNNGLPTPSVISKPGWAFGVLLIASDFMETIPVVFAIAITFMLAQSAQKIKQTATPATPTKKPTTKAG